MPRGIFGCQSLGNEGTTINDTWQAVARDAARKEIGNKTNTRRVGGGN